MLEKELAQAAIPLRRQRLQAQVEAHPGALSDALQRIALQLEVEKKYRLQRPCSLFIGGIGDITPAAAFAERGAGKRLRSRRHLALQPGRRRRSASRQKDFDASAVGAQKRGALVGNDGANGRG